MEIEGIRAILKHIGGILDEIDEALDEVNDEKPGAEQDEQTENWQGFLDQHPELTKETPIDFTDAELLGALRRAEEHRLTTKWRSKEKVRGAYTEEVAEALTGNKNVGTGNLIRFGRALGRLERAGRVLRTKTYGYPLWLARDDA